MRLRTIAMFAVGYVVGARAGHDRYAQIRAVAERYSQRLEEYATSAQENAADDSRARRTDRPSSG